MKKIFILILSFFILSINTISAQDFNAGEVCEGCTYVDIIPDNCLITIPNYYGLGYSESLSIDIDKDGTNDFQFYVYQYNALAGFIKRCTINSLNSTSRILSFIDTSYFFTGPDLFDTYIENVVDTISYGSQIYDFSNSSNNCYIWSRSCCEISKPQIHTWNNIGDHYIGFSFLYNSETIYGWLRLNVTYLDYNYTLTIKDYAYNSTQTDIEEVEGIEDISVYPNPARDYIIFDLRETTNKFQQIFITNTFGQLVEVLTIENKKIVWDVRDIQSGLYFYNFNTNEISKSGKILISK